MFIDSYTKAYTCIIVVIESFDLLLVVFKYSRYFGRKGY